MGYQAIVDREDIHEAVDRWEAAFDRMGTRQHAFSENSIWVKRRGFWFAAGGWERAGGFRYWNGIGTGSVGRRSGTSLWRLIRPMVRCRGGGRV